MKVLIACLACLAVVLVVEAALKENASSKADKIMPDRRVLTPSEDIQGHGQGHGHGHGRGHGDRRGHGRGHHIIHNSRKDMRKILNANSHYDFQLVHSEKTLIGNTKQRLQVTYDGLEVLGISMQATYDRTKGYTGGLTGQMVSDIEEDIPDSSACQRSDEFIFTLGKERFGLAADCELCRLVDAQRAILLDEESTAHLVYTIDIIDDNPVNISRPYFVVDACSLETYEMFNRKEDNMEPSLFSESKPKRDTETEYNMYKRASCSTRASGLGGNPKTPRMYYGRPPYCLDVTMNGNRCVLQNYYVRVIDMDQTTNTAGKQAFQYNCYNPYDAINGANSANLDAFFYSSVMSSVFRTNYGISRPLGSRMTLYTHYYHNYQNAFWDGSSVKFGDGASYFYPLVSLDILSHEVAHGITDRYSNLYYSKQSGGINEAFSDITGEAVEYLATYRDNDWEVGYEIIKQLYQSLRSFQDPTRDGRSIAHIRNYYDGLDVHYSSGLYNKAFYEMVVTQRIPMRDAYHCFLRANQMYWGVNTNFVQGACDVQSAAADLGVSTYRVRNAFAVVGIDSNSCGGNAPLDTLYPGRVRFYVSRYTNPCFLLLPKNNYWYYVYIYTQNSSGVNVYITIKNGVTGQDIGTRTNRLGFYLPNSREDRLACFSSYSGVTVYVDTYYCGSDTCYH